MKKIKRVFILIAAMMVGVSAFAAATDEQAEPDIKYKVNLVMDDGTVIFYAGSKQGVKVGDEYALYRANKQVGTIKVSRVTDLAAYCKTKSGDAKEMDGLAQTKTGAAVTSGPKTTEKTPEEIAEEKAKKDEEEKKKKEATDRKKQEDAEKKKKQEAAEKAKADSEKNDTAAKAPPAEKKPTPKYQPKEELPFAAPTNFGTTGLLFMPTAQVLPGKVNVYFNTVKGDHYTDDGYGVVLNMDNMVELSYTRVKTKLEESSLLTWWGPINIDFKADVISAKYTTAGRGAKKRNGTMSAVKIPGSKKGGGLNAGKMNYAAGAIVYKQTLTLSMWGASASDSEEATRFYAVATTEYNNIKAHAGIYTQDGSLLTGTTDDGVGIMGGIEYQLGGSGGGAMSALSLIAEYDQKAFYLGTKRTPSVGLRYVGDDYSVTLGMVDVTQKKTMSLGGSYGF